MLGRMAWSRDTRGWDRVAGSRSTWCRSRCRRWRRWRMWMTRCRCWSWRMVITWWMSVRLSTGKSDRGYERQERLGECHGKHGEHGQCSDQDGNRVAEESHYNHKCEHECPEEQMGLHWSHENRGVRHLARFGTKLRTDGWIEGLMDWPFSHGHPAFSPPSALNTLQPHTAFRHLTDQDAC